MVATADRDLTRRVLLTYAQLPVLYRYMAAADAQMGRRLPGLVRRSGLQLDSVRRTPPSCRRGPGRRRRGWRR